MGKQALETRNGDLDSKNILVVGNGFDLYHNLPTNYKDFIDVINRLIQKEEEDGIGIVKFLKYLFGTDSPLYTSNEDIKKCFDTYNTRITNTELDPDQLKEMLKLAQNNIWFKYFNMCIKGNIGWIDFEKEIRYVVENFELFFNQVKVNHGPLLLIQDNHLLIKSEKLSMNVKQVLNLFEFFKDENYGDEHDFIRIKKDFAIKRNTPNDGIMLMGIDEKKIMDVLADELDSFSKLFELYITEIINKISIDQTIFNTIIFDKIDGVISFNYTDTYKNIYNKNITDQDIEFIHGKAGNDDVVFGINSDSHDELEDFNENYIKFKKEYRRLRNGNLLNYRKILNCDKKINFIFFGHSLDTTDEDILKELILWENANCIIYYIDQKAKNNYIVNLYKFFGREKIKELVAKDKIEFRLISDYEPIIAKKI